MINIDRKLRLRDLEVYRFFKDHKMLAYIIIEDTRGPYTEQDKKLDPLCFLDDEDINAIVNVFKIYILNDEPLSKDNSFLISDFFGQLVNNSAQTNYIVQEYVHSSLYDDVSEYPEIEAYQKMLELVGSNYKIQPIIDNNWLYLAQD
ncbi:hypothetical protein [Kurthia massiliensis]|uniref:hypothetical protein n=1 Tax=Kurthia massiliensis TaxID=1033739 RepID=UPI0002890345|nr:hypothetical protein [Kurthia massiliensis]